MPDEKPQKHQKSPGEILETFRSMGYPQRDPSGGRVFRAEYWATPEEYKQLLDDGFVEELDTYHSVVMVQCVVRKLSPEMMEG